VVDVSNPGGGRRREVVMYARATALEIDTMRLGVDDAVALFRDAVLPELREQPGFRGTYVLATRDGKGLLLSFWDTAEAAAADSDSGFYAGVIERYVTLFKSPPGRESYEVMLSELTTPTVAVGATAEER
jgi:heme-degrading monooxygenase HmoA